MMKNFNQVMERFNFKRIIIMYLVFAIIIGTFSVAILGYVFKDKLLFAYNYSKVSEKIEDGKLGVDAVKVNLTTLASQSSDIVDILILDKNNKVSFSTLNSEFADDGEFILERGKDEENRYLTYLKNPNVTFRLMKNDELMLTTILLDQTKDIESRHNDNIFFESDFNSKKIYLLSYTVDKGTGDKIYFISDLHPVAYASLFIKIVGALAMLFFMLYWVLLSLWVYQNARKSKLNAVLWGVITLFTNLAGLFLYLIYKQNNQTCFRCGAMQSKENVYCIYCGIKICKTCSKCDAIVNNTDCFCNHCGNKITDDEMTE